MSDVIVSGDYSITAGAFAKVEIKYYNVEANGDLTFIEMRTATSTPGVGNTGTYQATAFTTDAGQKYRVIATLFGQLALGAEEVIGEKKQFVLWESEAVL